MFSDEQHAQSVCQPPTSSLSDATVSVQPNLSIASSSIGNLQSTLSNTSTTTTPNSVDGASEFQVEIDNGPAGAVEAAAPVGFMPDASMMTTPHSADLDTTPLASEAHVVASTSATASNVVSLNASLVVPSSRTALDAAAADALVTLRANMMGVTASYAKSLPSPEGIPLDLSQSSRYYELIEDSSNDSSFALRGFAPADDDKSGGRSRSSSVGSLSQDGDTSASEKSVLAISERRKPLYREAKRPVSYSDEAPQENSTCAKRGRGGRKSGRGGAGAGGKGAAGAGAKRGDGGGGGRGGKSKDDMKKNTKKKIGLQDNFQELIRTANLKAASQVKFSGLTYSAAENNRMSSLDPPAFL